MPALTFAQGKLQLIYYDLREDVSQLFGPFVDEAADPDRARTPRVRHTIDVRGAQADPGCRHPAVRRIVRSSRSTRRRRARLDRPSSSSSSARRTCRSSAPARRRSWATTSTSRPTRRLCCNGSTWSFNTARNGQRRSSTRIWTDNRDVRPPANGDWTAYTPPNPPFARPTTSGFDPIAADSGLRPRPGRDAQSEHLHHAHHARARRRRARQLAPLDDDSAQLPCLRPEQRHRRRGPIG